LSAQLEGKKYTLDKSYINLSELLTQLVQKFTGPRALENNVFTDIEPDVYGNFDKNALEMIFYNLLNNAVKYADNIPEITVKLKKDKDFVEISFADKGIGISDEDKKLIFQKFYRIGNENIRKTKGTGLGLYIVHNLVQLHNGEINVQNNVPRGCVFIIKLPLK
jgi:signal transduction histidine kinase